MYDWRAICPLPEKSSEKRLEKKPKKRSESPNLGAQRSIHAEKRACREDLRVYDRRAKQAKARIQRTIAQRKTRFRATGEQVEGLGFRVYGLGRV